MRLARRVLPAAIVAATFALGGIPSASASPQAGQWFLFGGKTGSLVTEWQHALGIKADGTFGPSTVQATREFQTRAGILVDGIVGPQTRAAMEWTSHGTYYGNQVNDVVAARPAHTSGSAGSVHTASRASTSGGSYTGSHDWNRVAACESGGDWRYGAPGGHTDPGYSQFQGGLNFAPSTWNAYKSPGDPSNAGEASKDEQIRVAERVFSAQGAGAWPVCGRGVL